MTSSYHFVYDGVSSHVNTIGVFFERAELPIIMEGKSRHIFQTTFSAKTTYYESLKSLQGTI